MRSTIASLLFSAFVLVAPGAVAAGDSQSTQAPKTASTDNGDKVVCKTEEVTGSRIPGHKVCHTQRDWDQMGADGRRNTQDFQDRSSQMTPLRGG
jgi:hypothetical protein